MSPRSTAQAALLGVALLASGCVHDLGVGLSEASPDDQNPDDDSPSETDSGAASEDAGNRRDAGSDASSGRDAGSDAGARSDAQVALDAATGDSGARPRDAGASDTGRADACTQSGATRCVEPDAGEPEPCLEFECTAVLFMPVSDDVCEGNWVCTRDDAGVCGWYCGPPFIAQAGEDPVISILGDAAAGDAAAGDGAARQSDTEAQSDAAAESDAASLSEPAAPSDAAPPSDTAQGDGGL